MKRSEQGVAQSGGCDGDVAVCTPSCGAAVRVIDDHDWSADLAAWWRRRPPAFPPNPSHTPWRAASLRRALSELRWAALAHRQATGEAPPSLRAAVVTVREQLEACERALAEVHAARRAWEAEGRVLRVRAAREGKPPPLPRQRSDYYRARWAREKEARERVRRSRVWWEWRRAMAWVEHGRSPGPRTVWTGETVAQLRGLRASSARRRELEG